MTFNADKEAEWRAAFERDGECLVYNAINGRTCGIYPEDKRQYAIRCLRNREQARKVREQQTYWYIRWTFWAAVIAALVGVIALFRGG